MDELEKRGINIPIKHVSNSAATVDLPEYNFNMVRPGLILYGLYPSEHMRKKINLKPVMSFHSQVFHTKEIEAREGIGYGLTYKFEKDSEVGVIPIGYADGYFRSLSNKSEVLIKSTDKKAQVVGNICMDKFMVDITGLNVKNGEEVILFGDKHPVENIANIVGTINYEIVCAISRRVPRVYKRKNEIAFVRDELVKSEK
jgi:alanine racemase